MRRPEITGKKIGMPKDDLACLSFGEMALALGIDEDTLRKLHEEGGDSAPPRVKLGVRRWAYPIYKYREWLERRMQQRAA